jgi:hypothetical protein
MSGWLFASCQLLSGDCFSWQSFNGCLTATGSFRCRDWSAAPCGHFSGRSRSVAETTAFRDRMNVPLERRRFALSSAMEPWIGLSARHGKISMLFVCSALTLGNRKQKESTDNHCSREQSGCEAPAVALGSDLWSAMTSGSRDAPQQA